MPKMFARGQVIDLKVTGLGSTGEGVGKTDGFTVFAIGALPGETVKVKLNVVKKNYAKGFVIKIVEASPDRVEPACPVYKQCGGCQLQHLAYAKQLEMKRQHVIDALERIGHCENLQVEPTMGEEDPWHYRNKMQVPVAQGAKGKLAIGCFAAATHRVIDVETCLIQNEINNKIAQIVRAWMKKYGITAVEENYHKGMIRHIMGRVGVQTGEVMAVLITNVPKVPRLEELGKMLQAGIKGFTTLVQNINTKPTNVIMGLENKIITGPGFIKDKLGALTFNISPLSFFQVNTKQAEVLYGKALEFAELTGKEKVVDIYCGTGTITLFLAQKAKSALGIEIVPEAIKDAQENAKNNKIANAEFICGDAAKELPKLAKEGLRQDVIVLDPPRAGCEGAVLDAIAEARPARVVYVSCNPASLARDVAILRDKGYALHKVQPVDMFPQSSHVECVALMSRVQK